MSFSFDKAIGVQAAALKLRSERNQVLAENLANADTPNYKARDFDFKAAMRQAQGDAMSLRRTDAKHIEPSGMGPTDPKLLYRVPMNPSLDGNTVESQTEQAAFSENAVNYQAVLTFLGGRFTGLIDALRGE